MGFGQSKPAADSITPTSLAQEGYVLWKLASKTEFGALYLGFRGNDNKIYHIKVKNKGGYDDPESVKRVKEELNVMKTLRAAEGWDHGFKLCGAFQTQHQLFMIIESPVVCSVRKFLFMKSRRVRANSLRYFLAQLLEGIEFLHNKDIMHRNLSPDTLFLTEDGHVKIGGFKNAIGGMTKDKISYQRSGAEPYMSPERIGRDGYKRNSDWWSYAITFVEVMGICNPFLRKTRQQTRLAIYNREFVVPNRTNADVKLFAQFILKRYNKEDFTAGLIRMHRLFTPSFSEIMQTQHTESFLINFPPFESCQDIEREEPFPYYVPYHGPDPFDGYYSESIFVEKPERINPFRIFHM